MLCASFFVIMIIVGDNMKRLNFNIKDRKALTLGLCLVVVCVFTLTIAYAALNAVLEINGNAEVVASTWDIKLANPKVKNGSVNNNLPVITNNTTASFSATLNNPGEFYEFTIDVVNNGSIDAMIDSIEKLPSLTTEQSKFLNYVIEYENGESISTKQLVEANSFVRLKVSVEFRKDISSTDLPISQNVLDLSFKLNYVQADEEGTSNVVDNGVLDTVYASGSLDEIGSVVTIGSEQFYTIGTDENNVKLFAMNNLRVGNKTENCINSLDGCTVEQITDPTGRQDSALIDDYDKGTFQGIISFGTSTTYLGSNLEGYINAYKDYVETFDVEVIEARPITYNELNDSETFACEWLESCSEEYPWIYSTSYWTKTVYRTFIYTIASDGYMDYAVPDFGYKYGVRPVIVVSKDYFE